MQAQNEKLLGYLRDHRKGYFVTVWTATAAAVAYLAGLATEFFKQWVVSVRSNSEIRRAVRVEIKHIIIELNFYILALLDGASAAEGRRRFNPDAHLQSFEFYWNERRERLFRLPEWPLLKDWNDRLGTLAAVDEPLFHAISLFKSLCVSPLSKCVDTQTRELIQNTLRHGAEAYWDEHLGKQAGIGGSA
jgi:hypothetical protein